MKILFVSTMAGVPWGGSEVLWSQTAKQALQQGHHIAAVIYDWMAESESISELVRLGMTVFSRPRPKLLPFHKRQVERLGRFVGLTKTPDWIKSVSDFQPDAICFSHGNTYEPFGDPEFINFINLNSVPRIHICHLNTEFFMPDMVLRQRAIDVYNSARHVYFVSKANLEATIRQLGTQLLNASVIRNPVNLISLDNNSFPALEGTPLRLACVARLDVKYKGHDLLLESLSSNEWLARPWELHFYGDGKDRKHIENLVGLFDLSERVTFHGHLPDVRSIWRDNHVQILASRAEGTPLSLVESMLMARPAIVTDVGGNAEWIVEGESGFIAEGCTVFSLSSALERMWAARHGLEEMGGRAREFALHHVDPQPDVTLLGKIESLSN